MKLFHSKSTIHKSLKKHDKFLRGRVCSNNLMTLDEIDKLKTDEIHDLVGELDMDTSESSEEENAEDPISASIKKRFILSAPQRALVKNQMDSETSQ